MQQEEEEANAAGDGAASAVCALEGGQAPVGPAPKG